MGPARNCSSADDTEDVESLLSRLAFRSHSGKGKGGKHNVPASLLERMAQFLPRYPSDLYIEGPSPEAPPVTPGLRTEAYRHLVEDVIRRVAVQFSDSRASSIFALAQEPSL